MQHDAQGSSEDGEVDTALSMCEDGEFQHAGTTFRDMDETLNGFSHALEVSTPDHLCIRCPKPY